MQKETLKDFGQLKLICIISFDFFILFSNHHICVSRFTDPRMFGTIKIIVTGGFHVMWDDEKCSTV